MKTIGLIGGITWYSTLEYYKLLNEAMNSGLGGSHSAKIILNSLDFAEIKMLTEQHDWNSIAVIMIDAAKALEAGGASCVLLCANTMHNIAGELSLAINIPLIHIADATAEAIKIKGIKTVALLGTKYTMQMDFYKNKLAEYGIETIIPPETAIEFINNSIYQEFSKGIFTVETKQKYLGFINQLIEQGAEGIILGCTEIPILIKQADCTVPIFDTTSIHALAAIDFALGS